MDNLSHSLTGALLARAGLRRVSPGATAVLLISANIPDIDIVALAGGQLEYLEWHRSYTHSLAGLPVMALMSVLLAALILRRWLPFVASFGVACIGVASHLLLDWTNAYGIRLLTPFSSQWFHLDWNSLTDYALLAVFLFAFVWPYFARLVMGEIGKKRDFGRVLPIFALCFLAVLEITRALLHNKAIAQLNTVLYDGAPALQVSALPAPLNPWSWGAVVETRAAFKQGVVNLLTNREPEGMAEFLKIARDPAIEVARRTEPFQYFEYFARFPVWQEQPGSTSGPPSTRVELSDLRFGQPGAGAFHAVALIDSRGQAVESLFTFGSGQDSGWGSDVKIKGK